MIQIHAAILVAMSIPAAAQHGQHASPYAGLQHREIKALDTTQMDDLRAGRFLPRRSVWRAGGQRLI